MGRYQLKFFQLNRVAILIEWPQKIEDDILDDIIVFTSVVKEKYSSSLVNYTPAFTSLLLQFENDIDFEELKSSLTDLYQSKVKTEEIHFREWHIPVCYDQSLAVDIANLISEDLDADEIVRLHTSSDYRVYMIGFLPGFIYLGGLSVRLHLPRKSTPEMKVPKGAIAIGGAQTGIYPMESPGGWHIIGRTPLSLFDIENPTPTPINQGDKVKFYEISLETYNRLL